MPDPSKGERTRAHIVAAAAPVFNTRGYAGTSMSELMAATGLEKGGLYRHFESKDALALAAFDHAVALHAARYRAAMDAVGEDAGAVARLGALVDAMADIAADPLVAGGCPLLNTAVESDDAHPALRDRARRAMRLLLRTVRDLMAAGIERGELASDLDPADEASLVVGKMEGAMMLSRLFDDPSHARRAAASVRRRFESSTRQRAGTARPAGRTRVRRARTSPERRT